ncbi:hypothetical protein [Methylobacterium trifolii]|uniref:Uncharacterized protein n=1 Tax=Methylobacterium trifolii TaxID=1003092 RepID=A0ABQ4TV29_9HYPH|nr:hypothetical protein [Methylobacterium trifolii]GJE58309.1 hypothetical protein MPOCJGCO_0388 [Methylobacterium trifolii]
MADVRRLLYASPNGDRWSLCRGEDAAGVFVLHEPNGPSGGAASRVEVGRFLLDGRAGPEHRELLRLIGSLVGETDAAAPAEGRTVPEPGAAAAEPSPE